MWFEVNYSIIFSNLRISNSINIHDIHSSGVSVASNILFSQETALSPHGNWHWNWHVKMRDFGGKFTFFGKYSKSFNNKSQPYSNYEAYPMANSMIWQKLVNIHYFAFHSTLTDFETGKLFHGIALYLIMTWKNWPHRLTQSNN